MIARIQRTTSNECKQTIEQTLNVYVVVCELGPQYMGGFHLKKL